MTRTATEGRNWNSRTLKQKFWPSKKTVMVNAKFANKIRRM